MYYSVNIFKKTTILFSALTLSATAVYAKISKTPPSTAYPSFVPGQEVKSGEMSRVGPPWNWRPSFRLPGTETDLRIGGYIKADFIYDFDKDMGNVTNVALADVPSKKTDGKLNAHALESRLSFGTSTATEYGQLNTYLESHFMGRPGRGEDGLELIRHAYVELGPMLVGQTWSNTMSFLGSPRIVKLGSPPGSTFTRTTQVRYTMKPSKGQTVALSLEDHDVALSNADASSAVATNTSLPALTARYEYGRRFALAGMIREMDVEMPAIDDSELSWGVYAQYAQPLWPSATFKSALWVGEGIGSYVSPRTADGYVENGEVEAVEHASGYVAIEQKWSPRVSSTFVLSRIQRSDVPDTLAATERRRVDSVWANIFYDIMPRVSFGLEYVYAKSERFNGRDDNASRINAMMMTQF